MKVESIYYATLSVFKSMTKILTGRTCFVAPKISSMPVSTPHNRSQASTFTRKMFTMPLDVFM